MKINAFSILVLTVSALSLARTASAGEAAEVFSVWPGTPPDQPKDVGPEHVLEGRPRPFYQITGVSKPTVSVFLPPVERRTGAAVLVCPGGGLQRLAIEHEGLEVADWLTSQGITAFLLKYRVPAPGQSGIQDAQRAMGLIRVRAADWEIDPENLGVIGFSAGGMIAAWISALESDRQYAAIDATDKISARPDFAALIYPGGLRQRGGGIVEALATRITSEAPPFFLVHAFDDGCQDSLELALLLKRARVPTELHIYHEGGHGFGVRPTGLPLDDWQERFLEWTGALGFLDSASARNYEREFSSALQAGKPLPAFSTAAPTLQEAYTVQKRLVRRQLRNDRIAGFKGAAATRQAQASMGIDGPLTGVLFKSGRLEATDSMVLSSVDAGPTMVETEIGFITGVDISYGVLTDAQARDAVASIVPVIELPVNYTPRMGPMKTTDTVAVNVGSARFIVGAGVNPSKVDPDKLQIRIERDATLLHETEGGTVKDGQWANLRTLLNQITSQGYVIRAGSLIISGALGKVHAGEPGNYTAEYGELGQIRFRLE